MFASFSFFPPQASEAAGSVDQLYIYLVAVSIFFSVLIFGLVAFFSIKYRRKSESERPAEIHGHNTLELIWTLIPLVIVMSFFAWGFSIYYNHFRAPSNALEVFVVGKQWMWKLQHPSGPREINELHVPIGHPVKLTITSEDVIHSFYVPAFRIKMDAVPGRYTRTWFKATKAGTYHIYCAEYCGTEHSRMIGWIHVMEQADYQKWLSERMGTDVKFDPTTTPLSRGEQIFQKYRCFACHHPQSGALGPDLTRVFGSTVQLTDGKTVTADEAYIQESIRNPTAKVVQGYAPLMPTYENILTQEQIYDVIQYLKTQAEGAAPASAVPAPEKAAT